MTDIIDLSDNHSRPLLPATDGSVPTLTATPVPDEQRIRFWTQHFGTVPQWITLEPRIFGWMERLCADYCGGLWCFYTLSNGGAFIAPETSDET